MPARAPGNGELDGRSHLHLVLADGSGEVEITPWPGRHTGEQSMQRRVVAGKVGARSYENESSEAPNQWRGGPRATMNRGRERFSQHQPDEASWVGQGFDDPLAVRGTWRSAPALLSTATWAPDLPARPLSTRRSTAKIKKGDLGSPRRTNHECYLRTSGDLVNRRVGDLISLKLMSSLATFPSAFSSSG